MSQLKGIVTNAELCAPIAEVEIARLNTSGQVEEVTYSNYQGLWKLLSFKDEDRVIFSKAGFVSKEYNADPLPEVVRLLDDQLIGYQKKLWFLPGEEVEAYIHAPVEFSAILYRHGLYKEAVLDLGTYKKFSQNIPDGYFVESGLNWHSTFTYKIPDLAKPGLYSLLLEAEGQEHFAIPFVISTPPDNHDRRSKLLVLANTNTWQSYNLWGGRSRYRNFEDGNSPDFLVPRPRSRLAFAKQRIIEILPDRAISLLRKILGKENVPEEGWRFKKLTIQRPFTNCRLEEENVFRPFTNHLAGGEWRALAWLERENIPYDIVSGAEFHQHPELLQHYRAIMLSTHCEYWTREMYEGLKLFHEQNGLWILNLSGNTMYREIKFFEDGSTCWTGVFQETCADESQILGVGFSPGAYGTCAPFRILLPDHWVFRDIPINENSKMFGGLSLNQNTSKNYSRYDPGRPGVEGGLEGMGASGWETDILSKSAPQGVVVVARGLNPRDGADMVVREPSGCRGGLFSASSITFGGCLLIDNVASMITKNVISRALNGNIG
jgi:N,N-dimethylformamidase